MGISPIVTRGFLFAALFVVTSGYSPGVGPTPPAPGNEGWVQGILRSIFRRGGE